MNRKKLYLGLVLGFLGLIGMVSILTMDIPLPPEIQELVNERFSPAQIKLVILINPLFLLIIAVAVGTLLYQKVNLRVPVIEKWVGINNEPVDYIEILKSGAIGGIVSGLIVVLVVLLFKPFMATEYEQLTQALQPTLAARFLYGGITEEIYLRFGLMTLFVWIISKVLKVNRPVAYWIGIVLAAIIFAVGHFPVVFNTIEDPSIILLTYVLIGNSVGGLVFGWLYWKKGLESAFVAHIFIHVVLVIADKTVI